MGCGPTLPIGGLPPRRERHGAFVERLVVTPIITLLTDFGTDDTYVGQMKGAILAVHPSAVLVDLTHAVQPQAVQQGAFLLQTALAAFPPGTIHIAVVDPGVGGDRRALAIRTADAYFVGPDNGLLSAALPDAARPTLTPEYLSRRGQTLPVSQQDDGASHTSPAAGPRARDASGDQLGQAVLTPLPPSLRAVELRNPALRRPIVSNTFHGRDIFGPAAGHLARGVDLEEFGPLVGSMLAFPPFQAEPRPDGALDARVLSIDRFGNLITDCRSEQAPPVPLRVELGGHTARGLAPTYAAAEGLVALVGSSGYVEIAVRGGSAAAHTGALVGDAVRIAIAEQAR